MLDQECKEERMNRFSFASSPFVAAYEGFSSKLSDEDEKSRM
jgi:hypothetical protein